MNTRESSASGRLTAVISDGVDLPGYVFRDSFNHYRFFEFDYFIDRFPIILSKLLRYSHGAGVCVSAANEGVSIVLAGAEDGQADVIEESYYSFLRLEISPGARLEMVGDVFIWSDLDGGWAAYGKRADSLVVLASRKPIACGEHELIVIPTGQMIIEYVADEFFSSNRAAAYSKALMSNYFPSQSSSGGTEVVN